MGARDLFAVIAPSKLAQTRGSGLFYRFSQLIIEYRVSSILWSLTQPRAKTEIPYSTHNTRYALLDSTRTGLTHVPQTVTQPRACPQHHRLVVQHPARAACFQTLLFLLFLCRDF